MRETAALAIPSSTCFGKKAWRVIVLSNTTPTQTPDTTAVPWRDFPQLCQHHVCETF